MVLCNRTALHDLLLHHGFTTPGMAAFGSLQSLQPVLRPALLSLSIFFRPTPYGSRQVVKQAGKPVAYLQIQRINAVATSIIALLSLSKTGCGSSVVSAEIPRWMRKKTVTGVRQLL
jgi:hypothetical protein